MTEAAKQLKILDDDNGPVAAIARIVASGAGKEVVEQMMKLVEWDEARRAKAEFNAAFSSAKPKFLKAKRSGFNKHLDSHYSLLEDLDEATRDALGEFGLSWRHVPATLDGDVTSIRCVISHKGGHSEEAEMRAPSYSMTNNAVNKLQSVGIVAMYLKRLTLSAMLGLVSDSELDNDGNGAGVDVITEEQALSIHARLTDNDLNVDQFTDWIKKSMKVSSLSELPVKALAAANQQIDAAIKRKKAKVAEHA